MNINSINSILIGKWKFQDGRVIEFLTNEDFIFTNKNGVSHTEQQKIFFSEQKDGSVQLNIPFLFEALGIVRSISDNEIIYDSLDVDGTKTEVKLARI